MFTRYAVALAAAAVLHASEAHAHMTAQCLHLLKAYIAEEDGRGEDSQLPPDLTVFPDPDMNWVERFAYLLVELDAACIWIHDKNLQEIRGEIREMLNEAEK